MGSRLITTKPGVLELTEASAAAEAFAVTGAEDEEAGDTETEGGTEAVAEREGAADCGRGAAAGEVAGNEALGKAREAIMSSSPSTDEDWAAAATAGEPGRAISLK